ncbi:MAG: LptF/LptG family permease, partial [Gammaproteobacteria bacterium]
LSPAGLLQFAGYLQESGQQSAHVELIFWQKIMAPPGVGIMALIAVPFAFASGNHRAGGRLLLGACIGAVFILLGQVVQGLGLLAGFSPPLIASLPLAVITGFAVYLYRRVA